MALDTDKLSDPEIRIEKLAVPREALSGGEI